MCMNKLHVFQKLDVLNSVNVLLGGNYKWLQKFEIFESAPHVKCGSKPSRFVSNDSWTALHWILCRMVLFAWFSKNQANLVSNNNNYDKRYISQIKAKKQKLRNKMDPTEEQFVNTSENSDIQITVPHHYPFSYSWK